MEDLSGKQLGQYQVVAPLGDGGMASIYKAYQGSMERYVALKILPRHLAAEPDFVKRFKIESRVIASLEHPNILPVYDFGESEGYTYLVMRFIEGGKTLTSLLQGKPLPADQIQYFINQISSALDYAHSRDVIHRDVKPSNVLLDGQGNCLLSDFGLAKVLISTSNLTASGAFLGTPKYASPEQCLGSSNIDQRSDLYSLGVILYEMVTGRPPFNAETPMGVVIKHIHDPLPLPHTINPNVPDAVERVILKALSKEPHGRYSSAGELAQAYAIAVAGTDAASPPAGIVIPQSDDIPPATQPQAAADKPSRNPMKWIATALLALTFIFVCVVASIWGFNRFIYPPTPPTQTATISPSAEIASLQTATPMPSTPTNLPTDTPTRKASPTTQLPSQTPQPVTATPNYTMAVINSLIARSGPGTVYRWVEGSPYPAGTEFFIQGRSQDGEWFAILLPDDIEGWVQVSDLETDIDPLTLPVVAAPPTPLPAATDTPKPAQPKDKTGPSDTQPAEPPEDQPTEEPVDPYP